MTHSHITDQNRKGQSGLMLSQKRTKGVKIMHPFFDLQRQLPILIFVTFYN